MSAPYKGAGGVVYIDGLRLHPDPRQCSHSNDDVCPTCDFDGYYESKYGEDCPWYQGDGLDQLYPKPEEDFWDDRTTPTAYSQQDSERDLAKINELKDSP